MKTNRSLIASIVAGFMTAGALMSQNDPLVQAFSKSYQLEKNKDYSSSISAMKTVYDSTSYEINLRLGWLNYMAGFNQNAVSYYQHAVNRKPYSEEARMGYNYPAYALGQNTQVKEQYLKILELDPNNTQVCYNLGLIYYYENDFKNALPKFNRIIELYPFDYDGLSMAAWTHYKMGHMKEAAALFDRVLLYSPNDKTAKEGLSMSGGEVNTVNPKVAAFQKSYDAALKNDYPGAIKALKDVYDKNAYEINLRLGYLYYLSGLHKDAMSYYKLAIDLNPKALEPRFGYVYPAAALGLNDDLIAQYSAMLQIDPQNAIANYRLGYIHYQRKDFATAYKCFQKVVNLFPFSYDGLIMFAKTNYQSGNKTEAKDLFSRVLLVSPGDKDATEALKQLK